MQLPWKQFLLLSSVATLLAATAVAVQEHQACYGNWTLRNCSQHRLQCQQGSSIFFTQAVRGFKETSYKCFIQRPSCQNEERCCNNTGRDCVKDYTQAAFTDLAKDCWNKTTCDYLVKYASNINCGDDYKTGSGYSKVEYLCLSASDIHNFTDSNAMTASSLALRYLSSDDPGSYVCLVEAADCSTHSANVLLAKTRSCSFLRVNDENWLPCNPWYATYTLTAPFSVWLHVLSSNDNEQAWAVIYATDSSTLRVRCKQGTSTASFSQCLSTSTATTRETTSAVPATQTTDSTTRPDISVATTFPSSGGTGAGASTAADVQTSSTSTPAAVSSPDVTIGSLPQFAENPINTAAVVGGVVGVVLLLVLVVLVAVVVVVFFLKRRSPTGKASKAVAWFKGANSSRSHGNSGDSEPNVTYAQPTSLPVYYNSAVTFTVEAGVRDPDSDYNHLGQKPASSASRDVTYGHLADGSDVTDYGYDHVTKGKPAVRSGDVINNVYDTASPATGVSADEDFYNTTGAAKNRSDVTNNVSNTAGPATGGSSTEDFYNTTGGAKNRPDVINNVYNSPEAEYYNTAGLRQPGSDVINIYDIPKSTTAPGPGEADDVTDADAGTPYEIARAVN